MKGVSDHINNVLIDVVTGQTNRTVLYLLQHTIFDKITCYQCGDRIIRIDLHLKEKKL